MNLTFYVENFTKSSHLKGYVYKQPHFLLTVKIEHAKNTKNTAVIARLILRWSTDVN